MSRRPAGSPCTKPTSAGRAGPPAVEKAHLTSVSELLRPTSFRRQYAIISASQHFSTLRLLAFACQHFSTAATPPCQQVSKDLRPRQAEVLTSRLAKPGGVLTSEARRA